MLKIIDLPVLSFARKRFTYAVLIYLLEIANISLSGFSANLRWTTNTGLFFNYVDSYFYFLFF